MKDRVILLFVPMQSRGLRLLQKLAFLPGQLPWAKCLQKIRLREEISIWLVDAPCVFKRRMTFLSLASVSSALVIFLIGGKLGVGSHY